MNNLIAPGLAQAEAPGPVPTGDPPCLRRRAPARIDISLKSGRVLKMNRRGIFIQAGHPFTVTVIPQSPSARVEMTAELPLQAIVSASRVEGGSVASYHAEFSGAPPRGIIPIPKAGRLHISVLDGLPTPCRITIPITVWPANSTYVVWWLLAFLGIVGLRWQRTMADSESFADVIDAMKKDLPHLLVLLALGFLVVIPLWLLGLLFSLAEPHEGGG